MLQVVILAGGLATRLFPVSENIPKALIEVNGKPFIDWQLNQLSKNGVSKVLLCVSHLSEKIVDYVGDGSRYNLKIEYSLDGKSQLGTGGAIKNALTKLEDKFMVLYGDSYLVLNYNAAKDAFIICGKPALMTVYRNNGKYDASNVKFSSIGIEQYEKNKNSPNFTHIDYGLNFFDRTVFENLDFGPRFELSELLTDLCNKGRLAGFEVFNRFYEIGSFEGIVDLNNHLKGISNVI